MSILLPSTQKFILKFRQRLMYYRDGFYIMPYIANSPKATLNSLESMPFIKNFPDQNKMSSNNPFFTGDFHYQELEEGLWLLVSNIKFKKNVSYDLIYDKSIPASYYTLSYYIHKNKIKSTPSLIDNKVNIDKSWILFKPGAKAINAHFAGSESIFLTINFSESWMEKNASSSDLFIDEKLKKWLKSEDECLILPELFNGSNHVSQPVLDSILFKGNKGVIDVLKLKIQSLELISFFIKKMKETGGNNRHYIPINQNRRKIIKAEKRICDAIFQDFPGVEEIASYVGMSQTKLKADFKNTYGKTLFKYYQYKQMETARNMLMKEPNLKITYIANVLGYANVSKFSSAFRNCFGYLPSEMNIESES